MDIDRAGMSSMDIDGAGMSTMEDIQPCLSVKIYRSKRKNNTLMANIIDNCSKT
jgi:hypothetical protein